MTPDLVEFWTLILTALGVLIAAGGVLYAIKTLNAALREARANTEVARAQFWVMVRGVLANYDDIHANLRPGGIWAPTEDERFASRGPENAAEWARTELYMGMFEYCEKLMSRGLLAPEDFGPAYKYRLSNLLRNALIVIDKLHDRKDSWQDFYSLCERFSVHIPSPEELGGRTIRTR